MKIYNGNPHHAGKGQRVILELDTGQIATGIITNSDENTLTIDNELSIYRSKIFSLYFIQTGLEAIAVCFGISEKDLRDKLYDSGYEIRPRA